MRKSFVLVGAIAGLLGVAALTAQAADAAAGAKQCVFIAAGPVVKAEKVIEGKAEITAIPEGWTPVGGIPHPRGNGLHGTILICR